MGGGQPAALSRKSFGGVGCGELILNLVQQGAIAMKQLTEIVVL
jgi:hypothetical protein